MSLIDKTTKTLNFETYDGILYHYTSIQSAINIIQEKKLYATDILYVNDPLEIKYSLEVFKNLLLVESESQGLANLLKQKDTVKSNTFSIIKNIMDFIHDGDKVSHFLLSFSRKHDSLSQWYMYAEGCEGLCLGFNKEDHLNSKEQLYKVKYLNEEELANKFRTISEQLLTEKLDIDKTMDFIIDLYFFVLPFLKSIFFTEEEEVRFTNVYSAGVAVKYRNYKGNLVPYREFEIAPENSKRKFTLKEIWIGPKCKIKDKDLSNFLKSKGFSDVEVKLSTGKIR